MLIFFATWISTSITVFITLGIINEVQKKKSERKTIKKYISRRFYDLFEFEKFLNGASIEPEDIINITYDGKHERWVIIYKGVD